IPRRADRLLQRLRLLGAGSPEGWVLRTLPASSHGRRDGVDLGLDRQPDVVDRSNQALEEHCPTGFVEREEVRVSASLAVPNRLQLLCELAVAVEPVGHRELEHGGRTIGSRDAHDVGRAAGAERWADRDPPLVLERGEGVAEGRHPALALAAERDSLAPHELRDLDRRRHRMESRNPRMLAADNRETSRGTTWRGTSRPNRSS